jgi:hypothetical protein
MTRWILLALLAALPVRAADLGPLLADEGLWQGVGVQLGGENWSLQVKLGREVSMIEYPTLGCSGEWQYLRQSAGELSAIEVITNGADICMTGGLVRLEALEEDMLSYVWLDAAGKPAAKAVLIPGQVDPDLYDALLQLTRDTLNTAAMEAPEAAADINEATDL